MSATRSSNACNFEKRKQQSLAFVWAHHNEHLLTTVFQSSGLRDPNLHRKEEVVKHQLRRRCLQPPTVTELVVFEDRSTAMVNPELRRQSVEIVDVRIICSIPLEIGGIF